MSDDIFRLEDTCPLVELYSVALNWSAKPPFRGRFVKGRVVFVREPNRGQVVCSVDGDLWELNVKPLMLTGLNSPLDATVPFHLKFFLKEGIEEIDEVRDSPVIFHWNPLRPFYNPLGSVAVDHSEGYHKGRAILTYSSFHYGVLVNVDGIKFIGKVKPTTVYGDIFLFHNNLRTSKRILFKTSSDKPLLVNQEDGSIPLLKSQVIVPVESMVHIVVRVYHKTAPVSDVRVTKAMFNIDIKLDSKYKMSEEVEGVEVTIQMVKHGSDISNSMTSTSEAAFGQSATVSQSLISTSTQTPQATRGEMTEVPKKKLKTDVWDHLTMTEKVDGSRHEQFA